MRLEIGNFHVKNISFGEKLSFDNGQLSINKQEAIEFIKSDERITEVELHIAKPGDNIRICPVKEAVEPRIRTDKRCLFPGYSGDFSIAGEGVLHALKNCSILAVGKYWGGYQDGLVDMSGAGQSHTLFGEINNIVIVAETNEEFEKQEQQKKNVALREVTHKFAEYIAQCVKDLTPDETEVFELPPIANRNPETANLPGVVYIMQVQSQMEDAAHNDLVYGWDTSRMLPTYMHPNEIFDGAVVGGSFMCSSSKWSTYDLQNLPNIKVMYREHGKTINFLGVIVSNLNVALDQKERSAQFAAQLARSLGAQGAVVAEEGYGNTDADFIACLVALEEYGIKTVGMTNECTGRDGKSQPLVTLDPKCDAIVSCGNVSELVELEPMEIILGNIESLARDGLSGGWAADELLGPSVREDGSIIMETNAMFCGDRICGASPKTVMEY